MTQRHAAPAGCLPPRRMPQSGTEDLCLWNPDDDNEPLGDATSGS